MSGVEVALCALGAFYVFAGYVATRAALMSHVIDRAIAAIACKAVSRIEVAQTYWLLSAAALVLAGGVTLLFLIDIAAWIFLASTIGQAVYLFYLAPRYFDVADPPDATGRSRSTNAFVVYLVATALVLWALAAGRLTSWRALDWPLAALAVAVVLAHIGYVVWSIAGPPARASSSSQPGGEDADVSEVPSRDPSQSMRIKIMADYYCHPLWALDDDTYGDFPPEQLELSPELAEDLNRWAEAFTNSLHPDDPGASLWSQAERSAHEMEGRALAIRVAREKPDRRIYILDPSSAELVEIEAEPNTGSKTGAAD